MAESKQLLFLLLLVMGVNFGLASCAADAEEVVECTDLCESLEDCFDEDVDFFNCVDQCEEEAEATIEACDSCFDNEGGTCMACAAECDPFTVLL